MQLVLMTLFVGVTCHTYAGSTVPDTSHGTPRNQLVSGHISTIGPGLFYSRTLSWSRRLSLRTGVRYVAYRKPINVRVAPESSLRIIPDFMIGTAEANLQWHPFRRRPLFLAAGLGYSWHPNLSVVLTAENNLNFDGLVLSADDVGTIRLGVHWRPIVAYVGWGFARMIPRKRIGVGFEMGIHYLGRPRIRLDYDGFLETTNIDEQLPVVARNLAGYRYLPSISFLLTYALKRTH